MESYFIYSSDLKDLKMLKQASPSLPMNEFIPQPLMLVDRLVDEILKLLSVTKA